LEVCSGIRKTKGSKWTE